MVANAQRPKSQPAHVAKQVLHAIGAVQEEVLADTVSRLVKAGLSAEPAVYLAAQRE